MKEQNRASVRTVLLVASAILCAIFARVLGMLGCAPVLFGLIRTMIYVGLYTFWGISIQKRVVQTQVRHFLTAISALMVFWFAIRTVKYYFVVDPAVTRYLWYLYYFPMLCIPLLAVYVSISLGKLERFRLPNWSLLFCIPTLLCLLLVLTNDWHRFVFTFPANEVWSDANYGYAAGYYIVFVWSVVCALTAFGIMVAMSQRSSGKKYLPTIILAATIAYALVYASGAPWLRYIGGDITAAQCLLFTAILESCIQCGLIRVNTGYDALFAAGTLGAQITDTDYSVRHTSAKARQFSKEVMRAAENGTVSVDRNTLLKSYRISGGYVLWQEDVMDMTALLEQLAENKEKIARGNAIERENYDVKLMLHAAQEKNRLYGMLQQQTARQIEQIGEWLMQHDAEPDEERRRSLLARIAVAGAYIKRKGNLLFLLESAATMDIAELSRALEESFSYVELLGAACAVDCPQTGKVFGRDAVRVYDFVEAVTEASMECLHAIWLKGRNLTDTDAFVFHLEVVCDKPLSGFGNVADHCTYEDGAWCFMLRIGKAGAER